MPQSRSHSGRIAIRRPGRLALLRFSPSRSDRRARLGSERRHGHAPLVLPDSRRGTPRKLVHRIESGALDALPGKKLVYASLDELQKNLPRLIGRARKVAMQYSPRNAIPYVSHGGCRHGGNGARPGLPGGEFGRSGAEVRGLLERRAVRLAPRCGPRDRPRDAGSLCARRRAGAGRNPADGVRPAAVDARAIPRESDRHRRAAHRRRRTAQRRSALRAAPRRAPRPFARAICCLLDVWGKLDRPGSVYYDITWVGYLGAEVPEKYARFSPSSAARDRRDCLRAGNRLAAGRADQGLAGGSRRARGHSQSRVTPRYFVHRTGHNIGQEVHGNGANMDGLETHDVAPHPAADLLFHRAGHLPAGVWHSQRGERLCGRQRRRA